MAAPSPKASAKQTKPAPDAGKAPTSTRALWKGAISFGLVHIPIALFSATDESDLNFKMLDKRTMDPVGYKRYNKKNLKEVTQADIVKGVEWEDGRFVLLTPEELAAAYPRTTQTIEIEAFIPFDQIPFVYLEKPYYTAPINRGTKVYALLREVLSESRLVAVAKVVIASKQHLAVLMPCGPALILNLLRWGGEIRTFEALDLPPMGVEAAGIKESEMNMARQLVNEMKSDWSADSFRDSFRDEVMKLVESKAAAGHYEEVEKTEASPLATQSNVVDLTELLRRSMTGAQSTPKEKRSPPSAKKVTAKNVANPRKKAA